MRKFTLLSFYQNCAHYPGAKPGKKYVVIKQYALLSQLHLLTCVYGKRQVEHGTKNAWSGWISTHVASPGLAVIYLYAGLLDFFWKTLFMHHEVNITSCIFQHSPYGGNAVLSGTCQLIFTIPITKLIFQLWSSP